VPVAGRQPALEGRVRDGLRAARAHRGGTFGPRPRVRVVRRGAEQNEAVDAMRLSPGYPRNHHGAERQPDQVGPLNLVGVEKRDDVPGQVVDGVRAGRRG